MKLINSSCVPSLFVRAHQNISSTDDLFVETNYDLWMHENKPVHVSKRHFFESPFSFQHSYEVIEALYFTDTRSLFINPVFINAPARAYQGISSSHTPTSRLSRDLNIPVANLSFVHEPVSGLWLFEHTRTPPATHTFLINYSSVCSFVARNAVDTFKY
ncbi:MAG: hypothetical protein ACMXYD_01415 [Candidatus Woesearchaeota archaeon]